MLTHPTPHPSRFAFHLPPRGKAWVRRATDGRPYGIILCRPDFPRRTANIKKTAFAGGFFLSHSIFQQHAGELGYIARAHGEDEVARARMLPQVIGDPVKALHIDRAACRLCQQLARHAERVGLARRVNVAEDRQVGFAERGGEFVLTGEEYKRPKGHADDSLGRWYNRKRIGLECSRNHDAALYSPELPGILTDAYAKLMPMYEYLLEFYHSADSEKGEKP